MTVAQGIFHCFSAAFRDVFKSVTADNGSEFLDFKGIIRILRVVKMETFNLFSPFLVRIFERLGWY